MPINVNEIMEACELLARQENLTLCIQESLKGSGIAAVGSFLGGVMLGPPGIFLGGAVGGLAGASVCRQYKPLFQVLQEMSNQDKQRLAAHMDNVLRQLDITDAILLMTLVQNPSHMGRDAIVKGMGTFFGQTLVPR